MKKLFKKLLSLTLVVEMLFNAFSPMLVFALEQENDPNSTDEVQLINEKETVPMDKVSGKGNIEVEVHLALPIRNVATNNIKFAIKDATSNSAVIDLNEVNKPSDGYYTSNIKLGSQTIAISATERDKDGHLLSGVDNQENVVYVSVNLYDLEKGTYTLELSGDHFITYSKEVTLKDYSQRVMLSDEKGMFEIGDVNGDEKVDDIDSSLIVGALNSSDSTYDLNLDGVVDIADLNYVTAMLTSSKKETKIENTSAIINSDNISFELDKNILDENSSDLSALFQDEGVVSLKQEGDTPIELGIDLSGSEETETVEMSEVRITLGTEVPEEMTLQVTTDQNEIIEKEVKEDSPSGIHLFTEEVKKGTIKVDLGKQVAVKKVTIVVKKASGNNLADIAKVEFLNNVKVETKQPDNFYTPENVKIDDSVSEQLTVTFNSVPNVTGYEIEITGGKMNGTVFQTTYTSFTIEDLKNYTEYTIRVQSVNQEWRSGWSKEYKATPQSTRKPPAPDMVVAKPTFSGIDFNWKDMDDTLSYNIYYRMVGTDKYEEIRDINGTSYSLKGLQEAVEYEAYITGNNKLGEGAASQTVKAKTLKAEATIVPQYKLINTKVDGAEKNNHIKDVLYSTGTMTDSNRFSIVDDNYMTYWETPAWHAGTHYSESSQVPIVVLDKEYEMDEFVLTVPDTYPYSFKTTVVNEGDVLLKYWNDDTETFDNSTRQTVKDVTLRAQKDENGRTYYLMKLAEPIKANAVQFGVTTVGNMNSIQISEVKIYEYDSLVDDVAKLFVDDLRVELAEGVEQKDIDALRARADIKDNDEYNPYRDSILADLAYAEKILNDEKLDDVIVLNPNISNSYNGHLKFAMTISDYQPLGIAARAGETLNVYVGSKGNTNVQLVFTQYHAEANAWSKTSQTLQKGLNIIKVPEIITSDKEKGGSVYIRYTSTPGAQPIKVRVSGGTKIPMVDLSQIDDETAKKAEIKEYIETLEDYNSKLSTMYSEKGLSFDSKESVLGTTEIVTEHGLLSVSSVAVENALKTDTSSLDEKVNRLYESTEAFDEMMEMFYRQKGLSKDTQVKTDLMPKARINIRYMKMFDGAFMYAGGYHVGIEYGSIAGLVQAHQNSDEATGYFGWGISHEIGHQINQKDTVFAEVTNNIYALLAQTSNDKDESRLENSGIYEKIYEKVTSHTLGRAQNVFTQLGMYWQLHLAYDTNKTFNDTDSVLAKVNRISRTYTNSKQYTRDELTILYACMATGKDLTDFFEAWGLKADEELREEINSIEGITKETRAIYYLNDAARRYVLSGQTGMQDTNILTASIKDADIQNKRVTLTFNVSNESDKILGYEILRNGKSIGFVEGDVHEFTDRIGSENNRAYTYQVVAYDYLLNKTNTITLEEVKVAHDGSVAKDTFAITSNVQELGEITDNENDEIDPKELHVNKLIDGKINSGFKGTEKIKVAKQPTDTGVFSMTTDSGNAYVIINLNNSMSISGIKYRALVEDGKLADNTINSYNIYVSSDGEYWTLARTGKFELTAESPETTVYFMGQITDSESQLWTYNDVAYVKIESVGNKKGLSGDEIDIIAPPGDNVELGDNAIGVLSEDYCYLTDGCPVENKDENGDTIGVIKKDSVVIQGTYRGNPSFNNILIADADNEDNVYDGYFLVFAELNSDKSVYEVAEGTWLYVMTKEEYENMVANATNGIRTYLYRVNDAITMEGQRLTSTSRKLSTLTPYEQLEKMTITNTKENN